LENKDPQRQVEDATRIILRPLASPLPLGFFAFGMGSVLQSALQFGLVPQGEVPYLALVFGVFGVFVVRRRLNMRTAGS
jgi:succinate-acetate transporter protein